MFKKNKLILAVAIGVGAFSGATFAADVSDDTDVLFPDVGGTVDEVQPKLWFAYDPAASGVFIDLQVANDNAVPGVQATEVDDVAACGDNVVTEYVPLSDGAKIDCTQTTLPAGSKTTTETRFCSYLVPSALVNGGVYNVALSMVDFSAASTVTKRECTQISDLTQNFKVDTSTAPIVAPNNPPSPVTLTWPVGGEDCIVSDTNKPTGATTAYATTDGCAFEFTQDNTDGASSYRVWVNDKNGIQVVEDVLSSKGTDGAAVADEQNGWMYIDGTTTALDTTLTLKCDVDLANKRTCVINIGKSYASYGATSMPTAGAPYKIWVAPWNAKGYSSPVWSDSISFDKTM